MSGRQGRSRDRGFERDRGRTNRRRTRDRRVTANRRWTRVECHRRTGIILTHSGEGERSSLRRAAQYGWSEERATDRNLHPAFHSSLLPPPAQNFTSSHVTLLRKDIEDATIEICMSGGETGDRGPAQVQRHSSRRARGPTLHMERAKGTKPKKPRQVEKVL